MPSVSLTNRRLKALSAVITPLTVPELSCRKTIAKMASSGAGIFSSAPRARMGAEAGFDAAMA